jgi:hypothetical protein
MFAPTNVGCNNLKAMPAPPHFADAELGSQVESKSSPDRYRNGEEDNAANFDRLMIRWL